MKVCIRCNIEKPLESFYKHVGMADGFLNKCKDCCKEVESKRSRDKYLDPDFKEKEKLRGREKYKRLSHNWKKPTLEIRNNRNMNYKKNFPEKYAAKIACRHLHASDSSNQLHHWSYNKEHYKDCIELNSETHYYIHRFIIYDQEYMMYRTLDNELLDTKEKHLEYINKKYQEQYN